MCSGCVVPDWTIQRVDWWERVLGSADPSFSLSRWVSTDCPPAGFFQSTDLLHPIPLIHGSSIVLIQASLTNSSSSSFSPFFDFFICTASAGFRVMAGLRDLLPPTLALALVSAIERQQATNYVGLTSHFVHFCLFTAHCEFLPLQTWCPTWGVHKMGRPLCHRSGAQKFKVAPRYGKSVHSCTTQYEFLFIF